MNYIRNIAMECNYCDPAGIVLNRAGVAPVAMDNLSIAA